MRILEAWRYFYGLKLYLLFVGFVFELKIWFETTVIIAWSRISGFLSLRIEMTHPNKFKDPDF